MAGSRDTLDVDLDLHPSPSSLQALCLTVSRLLRDPDTFTMEVTNDEKYAKTAEGELSGSESPEVDGFTWTEEEETKLVRK